MANYLTIDIGNSSAKAAVWRDSQLAAPSIWGDLTPLDLEHLCAVAGEAPACAAVCAVADDQHGLIDAARRLARRCIELGPGTRVPVSLDAYATPLTLGADRVAAMCGAMALRPDAADLLVVDCGSAVTYDLVRGAAFAGGNIAPGIGMRLRALHAFTARLPEVPTVAPHTLLGLSTAQAMQAGAFVGVAAEVEYYRRHCGAQAEVVLTGGRAADLAPYLHFNASFDPDLVLRGLKHIIDYNERS